MSFRVLCNLLLVGTLCFSPEWSAGGKELSSKTRAPCLLFLPNTSAAVVSASTGVSGRLCAWRLQLRHGTFETHTRWKYWRGGRRFSYADNYDTKDVWDKSGFRQTFCIVLSTLVRYWTELTAGIHLGACITALPLIGCGILLAQFCLYMMPSKKEILRCVSELVLLSSLVLEVHTSTIAVLGWIAWFCDLHCGAVWNCRGCTWFVVCLAQREMRAVKLMLFSCLVFLGPLYGKRSLSPQSAPSSAASDLLAEFPFLPEEFLAVLVSKKHYSENFVACVLRSTPECATRDIWREFAMSLAAARTEECEQEVYN